MATPHVSGTVALMREACPDCDPPTIKTALEANAIRTGYVNDGLLRNNQFGNGFIDGYNAVLAVSNLGRVGGLVHDASNNPIAGVTVSNANGGQSMLTDAGGHYYLPLSAGTYTISFAKFAYITQNFPGIVIVQGDTTIQNVTLQLADRHGIGNRDQLQRRAGCRGHCHHSEYLDYSWRQRTTTGTTSITNVPQGTYDMQASGAGCGRRPLRALSSVRTPPRTSR